MTENIFYLGEQYNKLLLLLVENETYNPSTGELVTGVTGFFSTSNYLELKSEYLYVDKIFTSSVSRMYFYDKDYKYLGSMLLSSAGPRKIIHAFAGSKYVTLSFLSTEQNLIQYTQDTIERIECADFIYSVHRIKPIYKTLTKRLAKESNQEFFRETLEGNITLQGDDFSKVYNAHLDTRFMFFIYHESSFYYADSFTKTTCTFDYGKQTCKVKLAKEDAYSPIMSRYDKKYDLLKIGVPVAKVWLTKRPAIQLYISGSRKVTTTLDGLYWEGEVVEEQTDEYTLDTKYHFTKIDGVSEFQFTTASTPKVLNFGGSFNNSEMSLTSNNAQYKCYLAKVASKGDPFEGPYSTYEYTYSQYLYSREQRQSYTSANVFAEDAYILRIHNATDNSSWESQLLFFIDDPNYKVLGFGADIVFKKMSTELLYGTLKVTGVNTVFARLICDVDTIKVPSGETYDTYEIPHDDFVQDSRNYKRCYGISFGNIVPTFAISEKPTRYGQDDSGLYFKKPPTASGYNIIPLDRSQWINSAIWYAFSEYYPQLDSTASKKYYLKDAYTVTDVIKALLSKMAPHIKHEATSEYSQFLYAQTCPVRKDKVHLLITQKTNVLKGEYDQAAQKAEISLEDVMGMLQKCFKCYFWIEDNKLRIEHISWLQRGGSYEGDNRVTGLDLTEKKDRFNGVWSDYFQSELTYDSIKLPSSYTFGYADDQTEVFSGITFGVDASYVEASEVEDVTISSFSTDIDYMLISPNSFSEEGFVLIGADKQGTTYSCPVLPQNVLSEDGNSYTISVQNGYLSWTYLLDYYMYDLPALRITGAPVEGLEPKSTTRFMTHKIKIPLPDLFSAQSSIKTKIGKGVVEQMDEDIETGIANITLSYEPR